MILGAPTLEGYPDQEPMTGKGQDVEMELPLTFQEAAAGGEKKVRFNRGNRIEEVTVKIPAGIESGKKLRLSGKGRDGMRGMPAGDLYLKVNVAEHPTFKRDGSDITVDKEIKIVRSPPGNDGRGSHLEGPNTSRSLPAPRATAGSA